MTPAPTAADAAPPIAAAALFGGPSPERDAADRIIAAAAREIGFMTLVDLPPSLAPTLEQAVDLARIFRLPETARRRLWRRKFAPENPNLYRGMFPPQPGERTLKEGIDLGPDIVSGAPGRVDKRDPLMEPTPLPDEAELPGWRTRASQVYEARLAVGMALLGALMRGLGVPESAYAALFAKGASTLRLLRYPARSEDGTAPPDAYVTAADGARRLLGGAPHVDSGFVTLLWQDGRGGLEVRGRDGSWRAVPPIEGALVVNFGALLWRWTGGAVRATEHRVLAPSGERLSIPFFLEPAVDAVIRPLDGLGGAPFEPFVYGDHLWAAMCRFVEFRGMEGLRDRASRL